MDNSELRAGEQRLERTLSAARNAELPQGRARIAAARALQAAQERPATRGIWLPIWAAASTAVAAALTVALLLSNPQVPISGEQQAVTALHATIEPMQIGPRVAVAAPRDGRFFVRAASAAHTELEVTAGVLTARLFHGDTEHELQLQAAGLTAVAVGTVYTVGFSDDGSAFAHVHEGIIDVRQGDEHIRLAAGQTWPSKVTVAAENWNGAVAALSALTLEPVAPAPRTVSAPLAVTPRAARVPTVAPSASRDETSAVGRWRRARLLRGQGDDAGALVVLAELSASDDPTWAPLALIEQMRIHAASSSGPGRIITLGQTFLDRFPEHRLEPEVRAMRCRAATTAGSALPDDCTSP